MLCGNSQKWLSMSCHVKCYSSLPVSGGVGAISPQRWIKIRRLVFGPLPKMINPREHYCALSGCAFSLPIIVLYLLLPSSGSLPIMWKEEGKCLNRGGTFSHSHSTQKNKPLSLLVPIPVPCCTVCSGLTDSVAIIEWTFLLRFEK